MRDVIVNFIFLVITLILAMLGAVVGAWLQHRSWQHQNWARVRDERTRAAFATIERASELVDRRLYRQRRLLWAIRRGSDADIEAARKDYQSVVFEWMDSLGRTKAELWAAFDRWTAINFEAEIHDIFARNGTRLEQALRTRSRVPLNSEEKQLNTLGRSSYEFMQRLLDRVQRGDINGLIGKDEVSYRNWDNLSSDFLLKRLFGLAP